MNHAIKKTLALAAVLFATHAAAQVTFYENEGYTGRSFNTGQTVRDFTRYGYNDVSSSVVVASSRWEVCEDVRFGGRCAILRPGNYPSLANTGLNNRISSARPISRNAQIDEDRYAPQPIAAYNAAAQITFYENEGYAGRSFTTQQQVNNFSDGGFNDRASSVVVTGSRWEVCEDARFGGRCTVLRRGNYPSLADTGLNNRISSVRPVGNNAQLQDDRYAPQPAAVYDNRRRENERLYEANVTSARAVVTNSQQQRCWVEQQQVAAQPNNGTNVPGIAIGAVIGGILGHQVGKGTGKDLATVAGAVGGGVLGNNVGNNVAGQQVGTQSVQRCSNVNVQSAPQYWDVTYNFRGVDHSVQMTTQPGQTITVNAQGEPRT